MSEITEKLKVAIADRYVIERELGQGGMATVFLAHDVRHDRKVALKVLRSELAAVIGAQRFLAEIKTTANLQHPHILPLFDSGEVSGTVFYVMPYVEGESLRDRLTREKQLPVADALRIAGQVAQALDYAHRRGVIHRDIKPENILLHDESALVVDFGIALAASRAGDTRMTETGMSLGTPHYMSPEQAMGERDLDARTDIYALGATLYEMLGGEPPFTGPTAQAIVARVLSEDPRPLSGLRPTVPPHVEHAVRTALQKLPADRYASAAALGEALARPDAGPAYVAAPAEAPLRIGAGAWLPWTVAAAAFLLAGLVILSRGAVPPTTPPSRLALLAPGLGGSGATSLQRQVALTPDGSTILYTVVDDAGRNRLQRQTLDAQAPSTITLVGQFFSVGNPVVSPDGRSIVVTNLEGQLYRLPMGGGSGTMVDVGSRISNYAAFAPDGTLWVTQGGQNTLLRFGPGDTLVAEVGSYDSGIRMQQVLPDGDRALTVMRGVGSASGPLALVDLATGDVIRTLVPDAVEGRYTAGYLLVVLNNGNFLAMPFDERRGEVTGPPVTVASGVSVTGTGIAQLAVAPNGTVAYIPEEPRSLVYVERSGLVHEVLEEYRNFHAPLFSPDGRRLVMDFNSADGRDVWVLEITGGTLSRATFDRDGHDPMWTPDGRFLTYTSAKSGVLGLYRTRPGSSDPADSLIATSMLGWTGQWLPDGSAVITVGNAMRGNTQGDIGIIRDAGRGVFEPLVASQFNENYPAVSHDQRWLAFVSDQSGKQEVYVRPFDRDGDVVQVSQDGGSEPVWSRDGSELFYRGVAANGQPVLMAAQLRTGDAFGVAGRTELFPLADYVGTQPHANYDVSPDGRRFVMVRRSPSTRIMIIQNLPALVEGLRSGGGVAP